MMITNLTTVKLLAQLTNKAGEGAPSGPGIIGDVYLDTTTGLTYVYTTSWVLDISGDMMLTMFIQKAEDDYLKIRGVPFELVDEEIVYPLGSSFTAAEMACYLAGIGDYEGRGKTNESLGGRSVGFDPKIHGYPMSIVGTIDRYVVAK